MKPARNPTALRERVPLALGAAHIFDGLVSEKR